MVIAAYSECFPLDVHSYFAQARSRFFGMPGLLSGGFFFWSGIYGAFFLCLLPEVGEVGFPNHGKGSALLSLVRIRIIFCYVFSPFDPLFPGFVFSRLHRGVILEKEFQVLSQDCDSSCSSFSGVIDSFSDSGLSGNQD